ncbi:MAG: hypothetical protein JHC34_00165 [Acidobacteria bacterium]|nr:hypothetical protein [Acidobacteriota bacterium]
MEKQEKGDEIIVEVSFKWLSLRGLSMPDGGYIEFEYDSDISKAPDSFKGLLRALARGPKKEWRRQFRENMTCEGLESGNCNLGSEEWEKFKEIKYLGFSGPDMISMEADDNFGLKWVDAYAQVTFAKPLAQEDEVQEALGPLVYLPEFYWSYEGYDMTFFADPECADVLGRLPGNLVKPAPGEPMDGKGGQEGGHLAS